MTLEEILEELKAIREEVARLEQLLAEQSPPVQLPPLVSGGKPDDVMEGPNEWGAVKLRAVEAIKPGTWVLWPNALKAKLNDQQKTAILLNCGYDESVGDFVPAAFYFMPSSASDPAAAKICGLPHKSIFKKQLPLPFLKPRWTLDMENVIPDTIAVRTKSATEIATGLKNMLDGKA